MHLIQPLNCIITYYKTYGIYFLKKDMDANHVLIAKRLEEEISNHVRGDVER
jgi:hypothetical protein